MSKSKTARNESGLVPASTAQDILDHAPVGIYTSTPEGRFLAVNPAMAMMFGYESPQDLIDSVTDIATQLYADPADRDEFKRIVEEHGEVKGQEFRMLHRDGTVVWVSRSGLGVQDSEGRIVQYHGFVTDITKRKIAEERISKSNQTLMTILESLPADVYVSDLQDHTILYMNKSMRQSFGRDCTGELCHEVFNNAVSPCSHCKKPKLLDDQNRPTGIISWECYNPVAKKWYKNEDQVILWDGKKYVHIQLATDITERKRAEEALREERVFQDILLDLATDFINVPMGEFDLAINDMLKKIGEFTGLDRVYLFQHDHLRRVTSNTHEWCRAGVSPEIDNLQDIPFDYFSDMLQTWEKGKLIYISSVAQMPNEHAMRSILLQQGIQSLIMLPLMRDQVNTGFVGFDAVNDCKSFSQREISLLRMVAEIVSNAFDRKRVENELEEKTALLEAVLDSIPDIMSVKRPDLSVVRYNKAGYAFLNKSQEQIEGSRCYELIGRDMPCRPCATLEAMKTKQLVDIEQYLPELDMYLSCRANTILSKEGQVEYTVELIRDITEQKRAELALRESEARFRNLFEHVPTVAVQGYRMDGTTLFWNRASESFYGFSSDEAIGKNLVDLIIPDEMRQDVLQEIKTMRESGSPIPAAELQLKRKNGSRIPVYSSHAVVQRPGHEPELFCIDINLTELKETERALIQAKEAAEAASRSKSEFLATMSHELRTPFNGIMGMLQLLQTTTLDAEQKQYITMAMKTSDRYTRLLSDLLDISSIEAGNLEICLEPFKPRELHDSLADLFIVAAREKGIELNCSLDPNIPDQLIGDVARIRQILFNLVGNALKFTDKGSIKVEMVPLSCQKPNECRILFSVSDTGIGIPEDKLDGLFEPFVQVDGSYTRKYQGAGLGLSIVKRLVDMMGGNISVVSTEGKGTTVHVVLSFKLPENPKTVSTL